MLRDMEMGRLGQSGFSRGKWALLRSMLPGQADFGALFLFTFYRFRMVQMSMTILRNLRGSAVTLAANPGRRMVLLELQDCP